MSYHKINRIIAKKKKNKFKSYLLQFSKDKPTKILFSKKNWFSEAKGRSWRFRCFARIYFSQKYDLIITGHTATDQSETAILQLIRGTSLHGMIRFKLNKSFKPLYPKYINYSIFF